MFVHFLDKNAKANVSILRLKYLVYALRDLGLSVEVSTIKAGRSQASRVLASRLKKSSIQVPRLQQAFRV